MNNEQNEQRSIEVAKGYFELFKHLTTLNLAAVVGVVAIHNIGPVEPYALFTVLAFFAASIVVSLFGLDRSLDVLRQGSSDFRHLEQLRKWAGPILAAGIMTFALDTTGLPEPLQMLFVFAIVGIFYFYLRRRINVRRHEAGADRIKGAHEDTEARPNDKSAQEGARRPWWRRVFAR